MTWKTCACEQWDEQRLLNRAAQIVDRDPRRRLFQPPHAVHAQPPTRPTTPDSATVALPDNAEDVVAGPSSRSQEQHEVQDDLNTFLDSFNAHLNILGQPEIDDRDGRIMAAMAHLRQNHECSHARWRWVSGRHRCEECSWVLKEYIFECRQCQLRACNRCRRNRL